jgi:fructoselysine-6-P-deglycase FrlB-like protein
MLNGARRIVLLGTGASLAVSQAAAPMWRARLPEGRTIVVRQSTEAALRGADGTSFRDGDVVIAVSQSGGSPETLAAARAAVEAAVPVVAMTAQRESPLAGAADVVVVLGSGEEHGAATKSALSTLAALLALAGTVASEPPDAERLTEALGSTVVAWDAVARDARALASADRIWILGFGAAAGLAQAGELLWHEKVRRPAIAATPSEFRHGLIEAATEGSAVVLIDVDAADPRRTAYLDRVRAELAALRVPLIEVMPVSWVVPEPAPAEAAIHALLRIQALARASALASGTYREEFAVLRRIVTPATDLLA